MRTANDNRIPVMRPTRQLSGKTNLYRNHFFAAFIIATLTIIIFPAIETSGQTFTDRQRTEIRSSVNALFESYLSYLNLMGDINEPFEYRKQKYNPDFVALFYNEQCAVYNDLDPEGLTSEEFSAKGYADNLMSWYNKTGINFRIDPGRVTIGSIIRKQGDVFFVDLGITKSISGNYMNRRLNRRDVNLSLRISFRAYNNIVTDFRIAGITRAGAVAPPVTTEPFKPKPAAQRYLFEPEMVFVQGGTFQMGSNEGYDNEKPVHTVTVGSFYMGKFEVTQKQWRDIVGSEPSFIEYCDDCPVESVSWNDVQKFIQKLNQKSGKNYRLPTEAEWEYAARGGNQGRGYTWSGGNNVDELAWYNGNSGANRHPVGQKRGNELGLFDMSGNAGEWCSDWYGKDYYQNSPSDNPRGPYEGSGRVIRGGSWSGIPRSCQASNRDGLSPDAYNFCLGFRLVLVP